MDELIDTFVGCRIDNQQWIRSFLGEFHRYLEDHNVERNCWDDPEGMTEMPPGIQSVPYWMWFDIYWLFVNFMTHYFTDPDFVDWNSIPSFTSMGQYQIGDIEKMTTMFPWIVHCLWVHEEGAQMMPEEFHALDAFCNQYLEIIHHYQIQHK